MAIFRFFKMAAADMLDFWNYKVQTVLTVGRIISVELRYHDKFRGDWWNRCRDISILDFSRWWQPPSWILQFYIFNEQNGQEGRTASLCQLLSKSLKPRRRYQFSIFQDGGRRHLEFSKFQIFNGWNEQEVRTAWLCQISWRSVKSWPRYLDFGFLKMAAAAILDLWNFKF